MVVTATVFVRAVPALGRTALIARQTGPSHEGVIS